MNYLDCIDHAFRDAIEHITVVFFEDINLLHISVSVYNGLKGLGPTQIVKGRSESLSATFSNGSKGTEEQAEKYTDREN